MTSIYFIRHAEPDHDWEDDRTRPLTNEGQADSGKIIEVLRNFKIDCYISSPYKRTIHTIKESAIEHGIEIILDERLRERESGLKGNNLEMFRKRWTDLDFHEDGGESLNIVQRRNVEAILGVRIL